MKYKFNEGSLSLPEDSINKTVHMLVINPSTSLTCSMIVSGFMEGESPEQFIDRQMKGLSRQLSQFKEVSRTPIALGNGKEPINGYQIETQFKQGAQAFHQRQFVAIMGTDRALVFTMNSNQPFTDADLSVWTAACTSLEFRKDYSV